MTTDRPYREALPVEEAFRRLQEAAGTQFDPNVVAVCLQRARRSRRRRRLSRERLRDARHRGAEGDAFRMCHRRRRGDDRGIPLLRRPLRQTQPTREARAPRRDTAAGGVGRPVRLELGIRGADLVRPAAAEAGRREHEGHRLAPGVEEHEEGVVLDRLALRGASGSRRRSGTRRARRRRRAPSRPASSCGRRAGTTRRPARPSPAAPRP